MPTSRLIFLALFSVHVLAFAQDTAPKKEEPKPDPKVVEYDKAIKDLPKFAGPVTLYQRKKEILMELPESQLGKLYCFQAGWNTGFSVTFQQGLPVESPSYPNSFGAVDVFKLEKQSEDRVWLIRPNTKHRWSPDNPFAEAISRSFPPAYLGDYRIEQTHPEKKLLLVNVTPLFSGDFFSVTKSLALASGLQVSPDREKSRIDRIAANPDVATIRMDYYYTAQEGGPTNPLLALLGGGGAENHLEDTRSINFKLTYSLYPRVETGYKPRLADPRIGYFTTDHFSFDRYFKADRNVRFINRWNLKKKDPSAPVSEPVKPIVWVLDRSVPKQYRDATRKGILSWNKAFEKLGYKNAVQVIDAPEGPDYDHADGRQNVVRWTVTNSGDGAIALARTDPMTGEILNASINMDGTFAAMVHKDYDSLLATDPSTARTLFRKSISDAVPGQSELAERQIFEPGYRPEVERGRNALESQGWRGHNCKYGAERGRRLGQNLVAIEANNAVGINRSDLIDQYIVDVIAHEMGHCLGLRHNFTASTNLSTAEMGNPTLVNQQGLAASTMDYVDINLVAVLQGRGVYVNPTLGPYDMHAIRYGYTDLRADTPEGELYGLSQIAKLSGQRGLEFMTDEDADRSDPRVVRFDNARDPLNYSAVAMQVANRTMRWAIRELPKPGESYVRRNDVIMKAIAAQFREARFSARFIGGISANRSYRGDVGAKPNLTPVDVTSQRQALGLMTLVLQPERFDMPDDVLNSMAADFDQGTGAGSAAIRSLIASQQSMILGLAMNASRISRIIENDYKMREKGSYTLREHYAALANSVMAELSYGKPISGLRRDLQRNYIAALIEQSGGTENAVRDDAQLVALASLRDCLTKCQKYAKSGSGMSQLHAQQLADTITMFLGRTRVTGISAGSSSGGFDLASLFGKP